MAVLAMSGIIPIENCGGMIGEIEQQSDEQLIAAAKRGNEAACGSLCERHMKKIFRVTLRITRNRQDAEDAMQDSFLSAFVHLKDFDGRSRFSTWLTRIAINSALMKLRRNRSIPEISMAENESTDQPLPQFEVPDKTPNPEQTYSQREDKMILRAAIAELRPRTRKLVELQVFQEVSTKEAARSLGISGSAVKSRMFHARESLRRSFFRPRRRFAVGKNIRAAFTVSR